MNEAGKDEWIQSLENVCVLGISKSGKDEWIKSL
jgi:predicted kinase